MIGHLKRNRKRFIIAIGGILSFLMVSMTFQCQGQQSQSFFNLNPGQLITRVDTTAPNLIRDARSITEGYANFNARWPSVPYTKDALWSMNPYNNPSWQNALYSLRMIAILTSAFELEADKVFLSSAKELFHSWETSYHDPTIVSSSSDMIWNDHVVANRVLNLIHLAYVLDKEGELDSKTEEIINRHLLEYGNWLYDDKNYTYGNHAVMMDRALLYLSYVLKNQEIKEKWRVKALTRFNKMIDEEVTEDGVCVENSPQYHYFMMDLIRDFISIMKAFDEDPPSKFEETYEKMKTYLVYVLQPNLKYPPQGDSYPNSKEFYFSEDYEDPRLRYIETKGRDGQRPEEVDMIFKQAGYAIFREGWTTDKNFDHNTYINLIGGYPSRIHKHSDNLSFSLYSKGHEMLIDPGNWGYAQNDTVQYIRSTLAHNTFTPDETNYSNFPLGSCYIDSYHLGEDHSYVTALFQPNPFENLRRQLIFLKPDMMVLIDEIYSAKGFKELEQIFNIGAAGIVSTNQGDHKHILADFKDAKLLIKQLKAVDYEIQHHQGLNGVRGLYIRQAEESMTGNQWVFKESFDAAQNTGQFMTFLSTDPDLQKNVFVETKTDSLTVHWSDNKGLEKQYTIPFKNLSKTFLQDNLDQSVPYPIAADKIYPEFGIKTMYLLPWREGEYSLIFKLTDNTTEEQVRKLTMGIQGHIHKQDQHLLSTFARSQDRMYESWNIKADEIIETSEGKFVYLNISTPIAKFKKWKLFLFDRQGYKRELWGKLWENFYLDMSLLSKERSDRISISKVINGAYRMSDSIAFKEIRTVVYDDERHFFLELTDTTNLDSIKQYKLALHTYVSEQDRDKLTDYSKSKGRSYDAWDFVMEPVQIGERNFIIRKIPVNADDYTQIKLFMYKKSGYDGVIGNTLTIKP